MNLVLFGVLVYVLLQLVVGIVVSTRMKTESDYYLAGRRLGYGVATMSIFATWFGAETCVGSSGAIFENGLSGGRTDPFGYTICLLFMGLVFAVPLYRRKLTTLGDLFKQRYGGGVEKVAVLVIAPSSVIWAGAQIRAFGHVIAASSEIGASIAIIIATVVVILYTSSGGLLADAVTDVVQGTALIIGLLVILAAALGKLGGVSGAVHAIDPERLRFSLQEESWLARVDTWAVPIFGSVLAQELISRTIATRSEKVARISTFAGASLYLVIGLIPAFIGLVGPALVDKVDDPEQFLPTVAMNLLPTFLYILFAGALISAILSTVDSALLAASSLVAHNVIVPAIGDVTERNKVRIARIGVVVSGVIAYFFAIGESPVYEQVENASAFGSAGIFVVAVFALFSRFGGRWTASITLVVGSITWLIASQYELDYPYILALGVSFAVYLLFGALEPAAPVMEQAEESA